MPRYLLHHRHEPHECGLVFASFKGHRSPLAVAPDRALDASYHPFAYAA